MEDLCLVAVMTILQVSMYSLHLELCHDMTLDMKNTAANFHDTGVNNNLSQERVMH